MKKVALFGFGVVGTGVYEIIKNRAAQLEALVGQPVVVSHVVCLNPEDFTGPEYEGTVFTKDGGPVLADPEVDVVVEVTGAVEIGRQYMVSAMEAGKAVVTANKSVVSRYFEELQEVARKNDVAFAYEASAGGAIPIIKPLKEEVYLNRISEVTGILNGTCNYVLTRMVDEGLDYEPVLKEAQKLGYAEADPTDDVSGADTMRKLRILSTLAFGDAIKEEDILLYGIDTISFADIRYLNRDNLTVKLLAKAVLNDDDSYTAVVEPTIMSQTHEYAGVRMAYNQVAIEGNHVGRLHFFGSGAGKLPTGDAIVRDVVDVLVGESRRELLNTHKLTNANDQARGYYYARVTSDSDHLDQMQRACIHASHIERKGDSLYLEFENILRKDLFALLQNHGVENKDFFVARIEA